MKEILLTIAMQGMAQLRRDLKVQLIKNETFEFTILKQDKQRPRRIWL